MAAREGEQEGAMNEHGDRRRGNTMYEVTQCARSAAASECVGILPSRSTATAFEDADANPRAAGRRKTNSHTKTRMSKKTTRWPTRGDPVSHKACASATAGCEWIARVCCPQTTATVHESAQRHTMQEHEALKELRTRGGEMQRVGLANAVFSCCGNPTTSG